MSTGQILDLVINYAYSRDEEIEKQEVLFDLNKIIFLIRLIMEKSWKLTIGYKIPD
jgi:hypothetical protein